MNTIQGYKVKNIGSVVMLSVEEGLKLRRKELERDKHHLTHFRHWKNWKPNINPDSYTEEEQAFMADSWRGYDYSLLQK